MSELKKICYGVSLALGLVTAYSAYQEYQKYKADQKRKIEALE